MIRGTAVRFFCSSLEHPLEQWPDETSTQLGDRIASLRKTPALSWLPIEEFAELNESIYKIVGRDRFVQFYRQHIRSSVSHPIYKAFLSGLLRIVGKTPGKLIRYLNHGYAISLKNCGKIRTFQESPRRVIVRHINLPDCMRRHDWSSASLEGTIAATLDLCEVQGTVLVDPKGHFSGQITAHLDWLQR